ncbi:single-stranded DNA-binding protein [Sporosarcina sp. P13]|uniref:single-stranded DNA-binding protein n=1 Tax=Sporosarcina sp. P13 TaxID=2048263 RepID=UPI000C164E30|nr:single-stranded DNA-binding protein [Sporosarcina sp. P13]PIC65361.1 single-stranded DNA-binding protein [Sporosarcina sp. P13]
MINRVVLVGRLTKDPELKYTTSGIAVCRFTLACNRPFKSEGGEQQADFIQCVAWRKQAENISNYLNKGSLAGVDGRIQTGSFEGQDGKRVYTTEVVADSTQFLEPKANNPNNAQQAPQQTNRQDQTNTLPSYQTGQSGYGGQARDVNDPFEPGGAPIDVTDDDLPF